MLDSKKRTITDFLQENSLLETGELPRLITMRLRRSEECRCPRCSDLLMRLHNDEVLLTHAHVIEQWALKYWLDSFSEYQEPCTPDTCAFAGFALDDFLHHHERCIDVLVEAERVWTTSEARECEDADADEVWIKRFRKIQLACEAFRKHADAQAESLAGSCRPACQKSSETL